MTAAAELRALVAACAPLWGGEAEVVRAYWDSPRRSRRSDLRWIARQCHKELCDGVVPGVRGFERRLEDVVDAAGRRRVLARVDDLRDELAHYCVFAELYDALRTPDDPPPTLVRLRDEWAWPENDALMALRAAHRRDDGVLGARAEVFTEGGCGALFREGMRLRGRGGVDDLIADACARVHRDEMRHMQAGLEGLADAGLAPSAWATLRAQTTEQLRLRIRMRAAQFDQPVDAARLEALVCGAGEPLVVALPGLA